MQAVRTDLRKLARGCARRVGRGRAARWHLLVLLGAVLAAFVSRAIVPVTGLAWLESRALPVLTIAVGLYALGWILAALTTYALTPRLDRLARDLDERYAWRDETTTALHLADARAARSVPGLLVAQTRGRLREIEAADLARRGPLFVWPRRLLAFLFAFLLLAPGVDGLIGDRGGGTQGDGIIGAEGGEDAVDVPHPMRADFWLQTFIENPLPVEPLPPQPADEPKKATK